MSAPSQGAYDPATGVWTVGAIAAGNQATLDIVAQITAGADPAVQNTARVTASDQYDLDSEDNQGSVTVTTRQGVSGIPIIVRRNQGLTTRIAIQNVNPNPGFTDYRLDIYDQNGFIDAICGKLNEKQVEHIDLESYNFLPEGYQGTAVVVATGSTQVGGPGLAVLAVVMADASALGDHSAAYEGFPLFSTYLPPEGIRCK